MRFGVRTSVKVDPKEALIDPHEFKQNHDYDYYSYNIEDIH